MKQVFDFLKALELNNNREWFIENKIVFEKAKETSAILFNSIYSDLQTIDHVDHLKIYRIHRDVRFSKDKTPYKTHFSMYVGRLQPENRGGYYLHLQPRQSFIGIGFFEPNKEDLLRIRKEIELDSELEQILNSKKIQDTFGPLRGDEVKTAPKGFDKNHERIALLKKKQFLLIHNFSDEEVLSENFPKQAVDVFNSARPFVNYMTDVLLTNLNGERI